MTIVNRVFEINLRISVLKTDRLSDFLSQGSNLFHSMVADGKNEVVVCIKKGNV